jgi:hypothetical protein
MKVAIVANLSARHQQSHAAAMAEGLKRHGIDATIQRSHERISARVAICWGWRMGLQLQRAGRDVLVMERGYLGDRFAWTSLGWNGLNGRAKFVTPDDDDGARFRQHFSLTPWRAGGDYVLIAGQVPGDMALAGRDLGPWYAGAAQAAGRTYGLPVRFRPHPEAARLGRRSPAVPGAATAGGTLAEALAGAAVLLTFSSNTAVDAVVAGVPAVTADQGSMAWAVAAHTVGDRITPDREAWAARLAWCQWSLDEIRDGRAWEVVGAKLREAEAA